MPHREPGERGRKTTVSTDLEVADSNDDVRGEDSNGLVGSTEPSSRRGILPNWPLRAKLVAVFALPTIAALFLAGLRVYDGFTENAVYERAQQRAELGKVIAHAANAVQAERESASAWIVSGRPADRGQLDADSANSDKATRALRDAEPDVASIGDPATTVRYEQAVTRLNSLSDLRKSERAEEFPPAAATISYSGMVDALQGVSQQVDAEVTDKGLQDRMDALIALARAKEYSAQQNTYLRNAAIRGSFDPAELQNINKAESDLVSAMDQFQSVATAHNRIAYTNTVTGAAVSRRFQLQQLALQRAAAGVDIGIDQDAVARSSAATSELIHDVENTIMDDEASYASGLVSSVRTELIITSVLVIIGVLLALTLMFIVAASLLRPLRSLRRNALDVADRHLPEAVERIMSESDPKAAADNAVDPVPVHTTEEIGQVARAFDVVHGQAVRLAAEQALLRENVSGIFVNLSRRSQRLVERQLAVIDRLEADEQDPDQLASLFELDHLATRMRRNGESLLVLSGAGLAKSVPKPVPAADVIGAAVSEIEQYARVEVGPVPDVAVAGLTIHDLVHVMAELLDNATYFSEPETKVNIRAVLTRNKALAIQVTDRGVGMSDEQITAANQRLEEPPDLDVSVTRRMGLYVVARLARRHGIQVRLRENEDIDGGVIARIVVPTALLDSRSSKQQLQPTTSASDAGSEFTALREDRGNSSAIGAPNDIAELAEPGQRGDAYELDEPAHLSGPMSLDELTAGSSSAAGPFLSSSQADVSGESEHPSVATNGGAACTSGPHGDADHVELALPKREPSYVPVVPAEPEVRHEDQEANRALDEDAPTRRLPIYQSVLSRWFSETENMDDGAASLTSTGQQTGQDVASHDEPDWHSAADTGWVAARSLLEAKDEKTTSAGLPKRIPNAHLVPGSIEAAESDVFRDNTVSDKGRHAVVRSATAVRSRMDGFQRGYMTGRHALGDSHEPDGVPANGVGEHTASNGTEE